jgi:segregation and condensation protein B
MSTGPEIDPLDLPPLEPPDAPDAPNDSPLAALLDAAPLPDTPPRGAPSLKFLAPEQRDAKLAEIVEAALLASGTSLSIEQLRGLFADDVEAPTAADFSRAFECLRAGNATRGVHFTETASGYRFQVNTELMPWIGRLWTERAPRYSRAMLETLALIAYRQPITRGEIEQVRGVAVNPNIIRGLEERGWIRVVGHRDVPGRPALFATTRGFLDYFCLKSLDELPTLAEIRDMRVSELALDLEPEVPAAPQPSERLRDAAEQVADAEPTELAPAITERSDNESPAPTPNPTPSDDVAATDPAPLANPNPEEFN